MTCSAKQRDVDEDELRPACLCYNCLLFCTAAWAHLASPHRLWPQQRGSHAERRFATLRSKLACALTYRYYPSLLPIVITHRYYPSLLPIVTTHRYYPSLLPIVTTHRYYPSLLPIVTTHCRDRGAKKGLLCRDLQAMPNADQRCRRSVGLGDHGHSFLEVRTVGVARNRMVLP
jgi:hypothetical protein